MVHIPRPRCRKLGKDGKKIVIGTQECTTKVIEKWTKVEERRRRRSASDSISKTIENGTIGPTDAVFKQTQIAFSPSCPIRVTTRFAQYRALRCRRRSSLPIYGRRLPALGDC